VSKYKLLLLIVVPLGLFYISLFIGRYPIAPLTVLKAMGAKFLPIHPILSDTINTVIFQIRLPRTLMAMAVGAGLSISGASFQGMFRNPLVSPDILGVSSAAGFGAALAILLSGNAATIQIFAFLFGIIGVIMTYLLSRVYRSTPILMLVLSGVVVSAFFSALISATKYIADPFEKLPAITFWLMGSLSATSVKDLATALPPIALGIIGLLLVRWRLNVLAMGDEEARALGIKTEVLKSFVIFCATIVTASSVCVSGMIGWVGLVIPHIGRMIVGPDHKVLLPATVAIGASYLLIIDNIARTAISAEIPLGILTAIIGAPFFGYLIRKTKGGWR
jgi:iron complex transport system permease protein